MITFDQNPALLDFASNSLSVCFDPSQSAWISNVGIDNCIAAVVVYTRFSKHNCEMSIATDGKKMWATRAFLRACYRYPFNQMGLSRITVVVEEDNEKSLRLCKNMGHVEEGRLKSWFGTKDGIIFRMLKDECKWL